MAVLDLDDLDTTDWSVWADTAYGDNLTAQILGDSFFVTMGRAYGDVPALTHGASGTPDHESSAGATIWELFPDGSVELIESLNWYSAAAVTDGMPFVTVDREGDNVRIWWAAVHDKGSVPVDERGVIVGGSCLATSTGFDDVTNFDAGETGEPADSTTALVIADGTAYFLLEEAASPLTYTAGTLDLVTGGTGRTDYEIDDFNAVLGGSSDLDTSGATALRLHVDPTGAVHIMMWWDDDGIVSPDQWLFCFDHGAGIAVHSGPHTTAEIQDGDLFTPGSLLYATAPDLYGGASLFQFYDELAATNEVGYLTGCDTENVTVNLATPLLDVTVTGVQVGQQSAPTVWSRVTDTALSPDSTVVREYSQAGSLVGEWSTFNADPFVLWALLPDRSIFGNLTGGLSDTFFSTWGTDEAPAVSKWGAGRNHVRWGNGPWA